METKIIILFCVIDDYLKAIKFKDDVQAKMSTTEIMTIAIAAGQFFGGNHAKKIHAVTAKGFELKILCFILAYSVRFL